MEGDSKGKEGNEEGGGRDAASNDPVLLVMGMAGGPVAQYAKLSLLLGEEKINGHQALDIVLNTLVGGKFDLETNFVIRETANITGLLGVIDNLTEKLQASVWSMVSGILRKSRRNLLICAEVGMIDYILSSIEDATDLIADLLMDMLGSLAATSISVSELRTLFSQLRAAGGVWPRHAVRLLQVLQQMPQRHGPDEFFSLPGRAGSGIAMPPVDSRKWPYANGWTFSCWLRLDPFTTVSMDQESPYVYCFQTNKGVGYSAHFTGSLLVVEACKEKSKPQQCCIQHQFEPRKWYMVTIVHVYNRWKTSQVKCFVNGSLVNTTDMSWLVSTSDVFDKSFIGCSPDQSADKAFCGQMSTAYVFNEALSAPTVEAMFLLGPGYKSQFKFPNECPGHVHEMQRKILYDGRLSTTICVMYSPVTCDSHMCLESSPRGVAPPVFVHTPHAMLTGGTTAVVTSSVHSALHSLGGIQLLFPLFAQLDSSMGGEDGEIDTSVCSTLMGLVCDLVESSITIQQQIIQNRGFFVISCLLEKSSSKHLTQSLLGCFIRMVKFLVGLPSCLPLLKQICDAVLFNAGLWIYANADVQCGLYEYLATEFLGEAPLFTNLVRRTSSTIYMLYSLKHYYWVEDPRPISKLTPKGLGAGRPSRDELVRLRGHIIQFIHQMISRGGGILDDELQALINYITTVQEVSNLYDVVQLVVSLMSTQPASMVPAFDRHDGLGAAYKLLECPDESVRIQGIKLLGYFVGHSTIKRKTVAMDSYRLFTLLTGRLMPHTRQLSVNVYNVLLELMTERICRPVIVGPHPEIDSSFTIENPDVLKVVSHMIRFSQPSDEVTMVTKIFLTDLIRLCINSPTNRRTILQMSVWQEWLFGLAFIYPSNEDEERITDQVMTMFRILLFHAVRVEYGGWRVWIDTLAIMHTRVSHEDFRIHMARMYQQYQSQGQGQNPPQGSPQPLRTVSGTSEQVAAATIGQGQAPPSTVEIKEITEEEGRDDDNEVSGDEDAAEKCRMSDPGETTAASVGGDNDETVEEGAADDREGEDEAERLKDHVPPKPRVMFANAPQAPVFRIPEFRWSHLHQLLLTDILRSIEAETASWKVDPTNSSVEELKMAENMVFVQNTVNILSHLSDVLITAVGGLLPLLSAATSPKGDIDVLEPGYGLGIERATAYLHRVLALLDLMVLASSIPLQELEQERSMAKGTMLRQCVRVVFTCAVRNCLEARRRSGSLLPPTSRLTVRNGGGRTHDPIRSLIDGARLYRKEMTGSSGARPTSFQTSTHDSEPDDDLSVTSSSEGSSEGSLSGEGGGIDGALCEEKLLQASDVAHLRAVLYRDTNEEAKQSQWLAMSIVYFSSVLMVSKYRDVLSPVGTSSGEITPASPRDLRLSTVKEDGNEVQLSLSDERRLSSVSEVDAAENVKPVSDVTENGKSVSDFTENVKPVSDVTENGKSVSDVTENGKSAGNEKSVESTVEIHSTGRSDSPVEVRQEKEDEENEQEEHVMNGDTVPRESESAADAVKSDEGEDTDEAEDTDDVKGSKKDDNVKGDNDTIEVPDETEKKDDQIADSERHGAADDTTDAADDTTDAADGIDDAAGDKQVTADNTTDAADYTTDAADGIDDAAGDKDSVEDTRESGAEGEIEDIDQVDDDAYGDGEVPAKNTNAFTSQDVLALRTAAMMNSVSRNESMEVLLDEGEGDRADDLSTVASVGDDMDKGDGVDLDGEQEDGYEQEEEGIAIRDCEITDVGETGSEDVDVLRKARTQSEIETAASTAIASISIGGSAAAAGKGQSSNADLHKGELRESMPTPLKINTEVASEMRGNISERLEKALGDIAPMLKEVFLDFSPYFSKILTGSKGQELLSAGLTAIKESHSAIELVMLLCSQEWQVSLQKNAGLAFIELVNEGRILSHATRDHIVKVANEAQYILNKMRSEDIDKHAQFEALCLEAQRKIVGDETTCEQLIRSAQQRDMTLSTKCLEKVTHLVSSRHGPWAAAEADEEVERPTRPRYFWKLDVWEDDSRRKRRLVPNPDGSTHPEAALKAALEHGANEDAISQAREDFHAHLAKQQQVKGASAATTTGGAEDGEEDDPALNISEQDTGQSADFRGAVVLTMPCSLVAPGAVVVGSLSVTKYEMAFECDEDNEENKKLDQKVLVYIDHLHGKWPLHDVRAILSRRYLLQNTGLEIFLATRSSVFFAFETAADVKVVVGALPRKGCGIKYGLPIDRRTSLLPPHKLFKLSNMVTRWRQREVSNFDYLVFLNTISGRTYNDLNQYPVFPWVLSNYESEEMDLSEPSNYRDLSKPMGALNPSRKAFFEERFKSWEHETIPPFHYGTHYSTAAFTLNWLLRLEPFTTMYLNLQEGKFDHADRSFSSVAVSWANCLKDTSDVKELIPEFYYLPEMFVNSNRYKLGEQSDGQKVDDVVLPRWAETPEEFVRIMRQALESEIVSGQLHEWIDLIFGYKQQGKEAEKSTNTFYYLTYGGQAQLDKIKDPMLRQAVENQIRSFGQTPAQLLKEAHPPRGSVMSVSPKMFAPSVNEVCMMMKFWSNSPVIHISAYTYPSAAAPAVVTVCQNHSFAVSKWNPNPTAPPSSASTPGSSGGSSSGTTDQQPSQEAILASLPLKMDPIIGTPTGQLKRQLGDNFDERLTLRSGSFMVTFDTKFILACGFWDQSFRVISSEYGKIVQVVFGHFDVVTCISRSEVNAVHNCFVLTGSKDCTCMVWHWNGQLERIVSDAPSTSLNPVPAATLTGHHSEITCGAISAELGITATASKAGSVLVHTLTGDLLRSLILPENSSSEVALTPKSLLISREGFLSVILGKGDVCRYSLAARLLKHKRHEDTIHCQLLSRDGQYLVTGGDRGVLTIWRAHDLTPLHSYQKVDGTIFDVALSFDQKFLLAALSTGCVMVYNIDFTKWHHDYQRE